MKKLTWLLGILAIPFSMEAQIKIKNASFEENGPGLNVVPSGWTSCGVESSPDVLPGYWDVTTPAFKGEKYMGLCARETGTWEAVGQQLSQQLQKKECYKIRVTLARSAAYNTYNKPVKFRIWGGNKMGEKSQLLAESPVIDHTDWRAYDLYLFPKEQYQFILIEPYYKDGNASPYRGNILIDDISDVTVCDRA